MMKKAKIFVPNLFGVLILTGCSDNVSNNSQIGDIGNEHPSIMKEIKFDGHYVQTNNTTWAIALEHYIVENKSIVIYGSFYIPNDIDSGDINDLENKFNENKENSPYVISYSESPDSVNNVIYSSFENTMWNLSKIDVNNLCYFILNIDISPLIENNKLLGELVINSYFNVYYNFNGESV